MYQKRRYGSLRFFSFIFVKIYDKDLKYAKKVFKEEIFNAVKIGINGELYWENIAEIMTFDGKFIPCEYDICPDFTYMNSKLIFAEDTK